MSMHNPLMYAKYRSFQDKDAFNVLQTFKEKLKSKKIASVIDLGCGDGFITSTILKQALVDFEEVIGVDVSQEMVKHAAQVHGDDKTKFAKMDVVGDIPDEFKGRFDLVFSNCVFQFITDQERAFKNIFDLLSDGGKCVLNMLSSGPLFDTFHELVSKEKWHDVRENVENTFVKLFATEEPENVLEGIVKKTGFKEYVVKKEKAFYDYDNFDNFINMVQSGNFAKLEGNRLQEFLGEFLEIFKKITAVERLSEATDAFRFHYFTLVVYAQK